MAALSWLPAVLKFLYLFSPFAQKRLILNNIYPILFKMNQCLRFLNNQKGAMHLLLLVSALAVIGFLSFSAFAPLRSKLFEVLYRKDQSFASVTTTPVKVIQLKYFPVDSSGVNIDRSIVGPTILNLPWLKCGHSQASGTSKMCRF